MKIQKLKKDTFLKEQIKYNFHIQEGEDRWQRHKTLQRKREKTTEAPPQTEKVKQNMKC